jgi:hypothetical protein
MFLAGDLARSLREKYPPKNKIFNSCYRFDCRKATSSGTGYWGEAMERERSPLERQAADALRRARRLPVGPDRNDLRQLAVGLLWLHRHGMDALIEGRMESILRPEPGTTSAALGCP